MKKYPILGTTDFIPFDMMLEHEEQCLKNHYQSVQRLAERGGTSYMETYYILHDSKFIHHEPKDMPRYEFTAKRAVQAMAYEWIMKKDLLGDNNGNNKS